VQSKGKQWLREAIITIIFYFLNVKPRLFITPPHCQKSKDYKSLSVYQPKTPRDNNSGSVSCGAEFEMEAEKPYRGNYKQYCVDPTVLIPKRTLFNVCKV
jgi:hypothetical protein